MRESENEMVSAANPNADKMPDCRPSRTLRLDVPVFGHMALLRISPKCKECGKDGQGLTLQTTEYKCSHVRWIDRQWPYRTRALRVVHGEVI